MSAARSSGKERRYSDRHGRCAGGLLRNGVQYIATISPLPDIPYIYHIYHFQIYHIYTRYTTSRYTTSISRYQHYIATSRYTSTVISKAKAKSWQNTCSSLSPKTRPSEVFSQLRSISGFPSPTTSDLPNFTNCHTPVDCANHLSSHLQSHFSTQTPKPFPSTGKAQMKQIRTAHCNTLHSTFCSPFSSIELSTAISQLSTSTSSGPDQITYPLLSHLPQSALNFLLYIFNLSWSTHTFPSAWKQSTIIPILKPGKPSDSPSSYRPISLTSCTSKLFEKRL